MIDTTKHQHLVPDEDYQKLLSGLNSVLSARANLEDKPDINIELQYRSKYRVKTLLFYNPEHVGDDLVFGDIKVTSKDIDDLHDDLWDELINSIDQQSLSVHSLPSDIINIENSEDHLVTIRFNKDRPYIDYKLKLSTIRIYPEEFLTTAEAKIKSKDIAYAGQFGEEDLKFIIIKDK